MPITPVLNHHELQEFLDLAVKHKNINKGAEIPPTLFIKFQDAGTKNIITPLRDIFSNPNEKRVGLAAIGETLFSKYGAIDKASLISEVWYSQIPTKDTQGKEIDPATLPAPSQDPNRQEALMMITRDSQGELSQKIWDFKKDALEQITLQPKKRMAGATGKDNLLIYLFFPHLAKKEVLETALARGLISESQFEELSKTEREKHDQFLS